MNVIRVRGAEEHNLRSISVDLPRSCLSVITGVSGSGKSSLAFDTIYKEGRRRFLESLPSYARRFLGGFEKARVERIEGLSPAISIEQKTIGRSPRSTVGTITEIHDHLRLLFARLGVPHCPVCRRRIESQSAVQVVDQVFHRYGGERVLVCAPVVRERKGEFRKEIAALRRDGYRRLRIDGVLVKLGDEELALDRRTHHSIDVVHDRVEVKPESRARLVESVEACFRLAQRVVRIVLSTSDEGAGEDRLFSGRFACPDCGIDLPDLEPRLFSFNSPYGQCPACQGLGLARDVDQDAIIADPSLPLGRGGLAVVSPRGRWLDARCGKAAFEAAGRRHGFGLEKSWGDLSSSQRTVVISGDAEYPGLLAILRSIREAEPEAFRELTRELSCPDCDGARLAPLARAVEFEGRRLPDICRRPITSLRVDLGGLRLEGVGEAIGTPILDEIASRLRFLDDVGLGYLTLDRASSTLSGGEAQRIRLASQVGAGLEGVCYVLDEPSIGLHPRDNRRLLDTLLRLRDIGNTVIVVEHDRETMEAADEIVDLGPGAGTDGGRVVAQGTFDEILLAEGSVTGAYLSGARRIEVPETRRAPDARRLALAGVEHNNLHDLDVEIPLGILVVVTGVSGSGKSSLIDQVLRPALETKLGRRGLIVGRHRSLRGYQHIDKLIDIDQSPIGRSPRSNPATYTKVFGLIRELFAKRPEARARGYTAGRFSFNVDGGRCADCGGAGVTVIDMQFLAPVEVTCESCGGRRYNRETLEITYRGLDIGRVLELTVAEACEFFADVPRISRSIGTLAEVGLGYIRLGQPSTTLSGGEAQRLKLAGELLRKETSKTLYILDEPTTGLHFEDIRVLVGLLQRLVDRGGSVLVIEHNLDVVRVADWVIDLGPEGGEAGGRVVAQGPPEAIIDSAESHTGAALRAEGAPRTPRVAPRPNDASGAEDAIRVRGATIHNLRAVDVDIPKAQLTVVTGVSGSGKTSLAFDTIFAEGQRRYIDSLSTYARQFLGRLGAPPVDSISGLAPAIAIDQRSVLRGHRSTVATATEIHDYFRLLFARVGRPHCPECGRRLAATTPTRLAEDLVDEWGGERAWVLAPTDLDDSSPELERELAQLLRAGFTRIVAGGEELRLDEDDPGVPLRRALAALRSAREREEEPRRRGVFVVQDRLVLEDRATTRIADSLAHAFTRGAGVAAVRVADQPVEFYSLTPSCPDGHFSFDGELTPRMFSFNSVEGACPRCRGSGLERRVDVDGIVRSRSLPLLEGLEAPLRHFLGKYRTSQLRVLRALLAKLGVERTPIEALAPGHAALLFEGSASPVVVDIEGSSYEARWPGLLRIVDDWQHEEGDIVERHGLGSLFRLVECADCGGRRLRREMLSVRVGGRDIHEISGDTIEECRRFFDALDLHPREAAIAKELCEEIVSRLEFLENVGLGYIALDRTAGTLSGGEAQRIRLASQLGSRLVGVLYVLDEPTIGLHSRDTARLLGSLEALRDAGNTVLVVEHDRETMEAADWIIDVGPEAGEGGGRIVAVGSVEDVAREEGSVTGRYLRGAELVAEPRERRAASGWMAARGANLHNLRNVDVDIPLGVLVSVTGVSGSGKSSLVMDVLAPALAAGGVDGLPAGVLRSLDGLESLRRVVVVDQRALGRTPKSTPATYTGIWTAIRELYASLPLSKARGYSASRFSFNSDDGRCAACEGQGQRLVEMQFLSDVWVECDVCHGQRFDESTLDVVFKGLTIADILDLTIDAAAEPFENHPKVARGLAVMREVGLGYLRLGQSAATLSGGEAQRIKLAADLVEDRGGGVLYILDEPTTGLHFDDVRKLLGIFHRLIDAGNHVLVIEHHLDVIASSDWVIELGPGPGAAGGLVVAAGRPEDIAEADCATASFLRPRVGACPRNP